MRPLTSEQLKSLEIEARDREAAEYRDYCRRSLGPYGDLGQIRLVLHAARLRPQYKVLDAGCGVGRFTVPLAQRVQSVCAIDYSARSIGILQSQLHSRGITNVDARVGDLTRIKLPRSHFDVAICPGVIHHIPSPKLRELALINIRRSLKPGGRLAILVYRWMGNIRPPMPKVGSHASHIYYHAYTVGEAHRLMRRAGYENVRVRGFLSLPRRITLRLPRWMAVIEPLVSWFPTSVLRAHSLLVTASRPAK